MLLVALLMVLAAAPADPKPLPGGLASLALSVERIALPPIRGGYTVHHDVLLGAVEIGGLDLKPLAKHLASNKSPLCPIVEPCPDGLRLVCATRQLEVHLASGKEPGEQQLELVELRGLPTGQGEDGPPQVFYAPQEHGLGGPCPGTTDAGRGECALAAGRRAEAAELLRKAFVGEPSLAGLRLGDLALAAGDPSLAVSWYRRAPRQGIFGRLAIARECEVTGSCLKRFAAAFDPRGLPEPARTELELRAIRARMILGATGEAARLLTERLSKPGRPPPCDLASAFCRRLVLAALRDKSPDAPGAALALYLALPEKDRAPLAAELARQAADTAASLGAPSFGANLMASTVDQSSTEALEAHLARAAELYLAASDKTRAGVIVDYARTRLTPRQLAGARWQSLRAALDGATTRENTPSTDQDSSARELAQAAQALARARSMRTMEER